MFVECSTVEALEAATLHPAQLLEMTDKKGTLEYHTDADFVFIDDELNIHATVIAGEPVYVKRNGCMEHLDQVLC